MDAGGEQVNSAKSVQVLVSMMLPPSMTPSYRPLQTWIFVVLVNMASLF